MVEGDDLTGVLLPDVQQHGNRRIDPAVGPKSSPPISILAHEPIARALDQGADIVVTGLVAVFLRLRSAR
jgi:hypothetical protein